MRDSSLRAWLAKSNLHQAPEPLDLLRRIASAVNIRYPKEGHAALRMWGQTGDRPAAWIAAADPVYLEPRRDQLCLHALPSSSVPPEDLKGLIEHLQNTLADDRRFGFARIGDCGYISADEPFATAAVTSTAVDQQSPAQFMPTGEGTASYRNLLSEIEMALHDHDINQRRIAAGQRPINSLWLWGGGAAPSHSQQSLPLLIANDPLLLGYWESAAGDTARWPGTIQGCLDTSSEGFVAVAPQRHNDGEFLEECLRALRAALRARRLSSLVLLFRDGVSAKVTRSHALKFWRRDASVLHEALS